MLVLDRDALVLPAQQEVDDVVAGEHKPADVDVALCEQQRAHDIDVDGEDAVDHLTRGGLPHVGRERRGHVEARRRRQVPPFPSRVQPTPELLELGRQRHIP